MNELINKIKSVTLVNWILILAVVICIFFAFRSCSQESKKQPEAVTVTIPQVNYGPQLKAVRDSLKKATDQLDTIKASEKKARLQVKDLQLQNAKITQQLKDALARKDTAGAVVASQDLANINAFLVEEINQAQARFDSLAAAAAVAIGQAKAETLVQQSIAIQEKQTAETFRAALAQANINNLALTDDYNKLLKKFKGSRFWQRVGFGAAAGGIIYGAIK